MNLAEKIEKIKRQPEHIKLRYIWSFVIMSMFFIIVIWIFSLRAKDIYESNNLGQIIKVDDVGGEIYQQKKVLEQATKNIQDSNSAIFRNNDKTEDGGMGNNNEKIQESVTRKNQFPMNQE